MKNTLPKFLSAEELDKLVDAFFKQLEGKKRSGKQTSDIKTNEVKPATLTGLALHLGFNSREQFERYESKGKFAANLKKARLRIEAIYEKKLHQSTYGGAVFALKNMGWVDKGEIKQTVPAIKTLKVTIVESGPPPAANEKDIILEIDDQ
ncbi:MAG: hypothetical protein EOP47_04555 [Sphingobacteriaceae bacterium]|nr:MAG: hypothetical protein EOP47_04555 [Sphingobacteriaceae bacterium]